MFSASTKSGKNSGSTPDPQFNYVTMLLHGDGTNGAQNNTFVDGSSNNFTITRNGNTTQGSFSPYGSNWSNNFGTSNYLTVGYNSAISLGSGDFTFDMWIFPTTSSRATLYLESGDRQGIFIDYNNGNNGISVFATATNGSWSIINGDPGNPGYGSSNTITLNRWNHFAFVRNGTNWSTYINGVRDLNITASGTIYEGGGSRYISYFPGNGLYLLGYMSNFRLVKGTALYSGSTITVPTAPLTAVSGTGLLTCQANRFVDSSGNSLTVTPSGAPSVQRFNPFGASTAYSTSVIGGSGYFDGSGDYLTVADNAALDVDAGDFTMEAWVYFPDASVTSPVLAKGFGSAGGWMMWVQSTLRLRMYDAGGSSVTATSSASLTSNSWNHVAATRSGNTLTVYVNGVSSGTATFTGTSTNASVLEIGGYNSATALSTGYISNARLVKGTAVYTGNFTPSTTPLTAISGTSLLTNFTNGAIYDNAMMNDLETVGNAQISTSVKKYGTGSLAFDGTGDWLIMPYGPTQNFNTGSFTIEMWAYLNSLAASYYVPAGTWGAGTSDEWLIQIRNDGYIRFLTTAGSTFYSASITTATWYHIAVVRNGSTINIYVNGTSVGSYTCTNSLGSTSKTLYIGTQAGTWDWNGYIDDFRITNGYARYTSNFTPPTAAFPNTGPN